MSKVRTNDGYKDIEAVYAGNIPIDAIYDKNGNILFSAYNEVNGISPLSFKSKTNNNSILKNYRIYGNTVSDESVGDKTNNLFDGNFLQGYWAYADGSFVNTNTWICTNKIPCTEGQVYTYSFAKTSRQTGFVWYDANGDYISSSNAQDYSSTPYRLYSATAPIDAAFMIVNIAGYPESPNTIAPSDITDFMLVKGQYTSNTMPSYEPYGYRIPVTVTNGTDTETTTLYLPEQIKMVGDEAEYIDFKEQKQHRVRKNLLQNTGTSRTINGVTFTVNSDGSVTCNTDENGATATAIFNVYAQNFTLASDNYILSGCPIGGDISTKYKLDAQVFTDGFESWISDIGDGANIYSDKIITILLMRIVIYKNQVCDNLTFYPMIRKADISDDTYEPYITNTELNVTLPSISVPSGINILSVETGIQPSDIYLKGKIEKKPKIYYYSDDRQTLLYTESVLKGENGTYSSPPEKTNYTFLGWQPRAININKNENCYAVFVEQNENEAILIMCATNTIYNNKNAINFLFKYSVPADKYDIVKIGIHYGTNKLAGANTTISGYATADLTVDGATYGVNDVETVLQTGANSIKNYVATYTYHGGKLSLSYALGNNVDAYALAIGYIQAIEKATGNEVTFYSNLISTTYNKCSQLYTVTFYNDATLLKTGKAAYGDNIIYSGATPTKASTQQYEYNFLGWNTNPLATTADINALSNVTSDRTVYAIFAQTIRTYTVTFYNENTVLETVQNVPYGGTATYTGSTPTKTNYTFTGWNPEPTNISSDTSCIAQFEAAIQDLITDSWETIATRAAAGTAQNYYSVGDCKAITLNGTCGTLELNNETLYVYILGFDHNSALEGTGITFGGFKTNYDNSDIDVALIDSHYNYTFADTTGLKWFNMNHRQGSTQYGHNYGGWKGSDMRYDILGSTDTAPSGYGAQAITSNVGYDASSTCATSPVANTLMSCLPSDLRAVMKPMTKYTDNVGNSSEASRNVTASIDYLPLLAEYEIFGARSYANQYEQNKQAQYAYYADGNNNKVKYRHSSTGSTARWWERSPFYNNSYNFCDVDNNGSAAKYAARYSYGVAPIFLVGLQTYTVSYYSQDGLTLLGTETVNSGQNAQGLAQNPTKASDTDYDYTFIGWNSQGNKTFAEANILNGITQNKTVYAVFEQVYKSDTISDSWEDIIESCSDGTYSSKYNVGDLKTIDLGIEGVIQMEIVGINADDKADDSNKAPITWISKQLLKTSHRMNPPYSSGTEGTDWEKTEMRSYLKETVKPLIPETVRNAIKPVKKYSRIYNVSSSAVNDALTTEDVWIPSYKEVFGSGLETLGPTYSATFPDNASRIKSKVGTSAAWWWLRSAYSTNYFYYVDTGGSSYYNYAYRTCGVALGFCT